MVGNCLFKLSRFEVVPESFHKVGFSAHTLLVESTQGHHGFTVAQICTFLVEHDCIVYRLKRTIAEEHAVCFEAVVGGLVQDVDLSFMLFDFTLLFLLAGLFSCFLLVSFPLSLRLSILPVLLLLLHQIVFDLFLLYVFDAVFHFSDLLLQLLGHCASHVFDLLFLSHVGAQVAFTGLS